MEATLSIRIDHKEKYSIYFEKIHCLDFLPHIGLDFSFCDNVYGKVDEVYYDVDDKKIHVTFLRVFNVINEFWNHEPKIRRLKEVKKSLVESGWRVSIGYDPTSTTQKQYKNFKKKMGELNPDRSTDN